MNRLFDFSVPMSFETLTLCINEWFWFI